MHLGSYHIAARLLDDAVLPPYKGSTFRGAFGGCLKKAVCAVRNKECHDCLLFSQCLYARLFEPKTWKSSADTRIVSPPHPYVIQPPCDNRTRYGAGEHFDFTLLLFGEMNSSLPYFVYAFQLMGEQGIGKKTGNHRARFQVTDVTSQRKSLYNSESGTLQPASPPEYISLLPVPSTDEQRDISIELLTPLRLKGDNRLQSSLPFSLLVRTMLRRASGLFNAWGDGEPALDYRGMVARAENVRVIDGRLRWHDWERYSSRQDQAMNFGGMLGTVVYRGALDEYLPLIRLCETLHVGKQTTFGLGRFKAAV